MPIESIRLNNFRNHKQGFFSFDEKNIITGRNGCGKTSIVEAISILISGKSFRTQRLRSAVNFDNDSFFIAGRLSEIDISSDIELHFRQSKDFYQDGKKVLNQTEFILSHPLVFYSPENEGFLSQDMEHRRKFLDRTICYIDHTHLFDLKSYNKLASLKKYYLSKRIDDKMLYESIHEKMSELTKRIQQRRIFFSERFNQIIFDFQRNMPAFYREEFSLEYLPDTLDTGILQKELERQQILSGLTRDKILFKINGARYEHIASFGQRKSLGLMMVYCFIKVVEEISKYGIITILDDMEAGLDDERVLFFLECIKHTQLFVTGLDDRLFNNFNIIKL